MAIILVVAVLSLVLGAPAGAASAPTTQAGLSSSDSCAECHEQIHSMWKRSLHGMAFSDPIFQLSYMRAYLETGGEASQTCLRCHAPVATLSGDLELSNPISREGITCDYCHSITSVDLARPSDPYRIRIDGVKRGPLGDADSPAHGVEESPLHRSAAFCAGCHEYANPDGLLIFSTYSEWKTSPQAKEGKTCQHCHMPSVPGSTVRADLGVRRQGINLHNISGGHSSEQVRRAVATKVLAVEREAANRAVVEVEVANVGSGHSIPTGLPTRKLVLRVQLSVDGKEVRRFERTYQRSLLDRRGRRIVEDHRVILEAHRLREDNRLRAGERRVERFVASVPRRGALSAQIDLVYLYEPEVMLREKMEIPITSEQVP
jgi:nitrate/TMAO reductase-like tetraheme cytochrome c subunit